MLVALTAEAVLCESPTTQFCHRRQLINLYIVPAMWRHGECSICRSAQLCSPLGHLSNGGAPLAGAPASTARACTYDQVAEGSILSAAVPSIRRPAGAPRGRPGRDTAACGGRGTPAHCAASTPAASPATPAPAPPAAPRSPAAPAGGARRSRVIAEPTTARSGNLTMVIWAVTENTHTRAVGALAEQAA